VNASVAVRERDWDWALAAVTLAVAMASGYLLSTRVGAARPASNLEARIATVAFRSSEVRRRPAGTLLWDTIEAGQTLFEEDTVYVATGASATIQLDDGARLELEENTLVVLERPAEATSSRVAVRKGVLSGVAGSRKLEVAAGGALASLEPSAEARVDVDPRGGAEVAVLGGSATVATPTSNRRLEKDQRGSIGAGGEVALSAPAAAMLVWPPRNHRLRAGEPIRLQWRPAPAEATGIQVAHDRAFTQLAWTADGAAGELALGTPAAGQYWWRAVDAAGHVRSETRRFAVYDEAPPRPISPRDAERLGLPIVPFAWSKVPGAARYEIEISGSPDFAQALHLEAANGTALQWTSDLPDGAYYWRVRTAWEDRQGPWSAAESFQLSLRPLPSAPVLINPELEVQPENGRPH
jgi:hypothetical protein